MSVTVPFIPEHAPFSPAQRAWLNGFLAGLLVQVPNGQPTAHTSVAAPARPLTILFGSQTGTAEALAKKAAKQAGARGFAAKVADMASATSEDLARAENVLLITSTYGDGEPPDNARVLHQQLCAATPVSASPAATADAAPPSNPVLLKKVRFSVCALGDSNYPLFCQCGKDFDLALERHGATRVSPRVDCDVDYEEPFAQWLAAALESLGGPTSAVAETASTSATASDQPELAPSLVTYSKTNPFFASVQTARRLNAPDSAKEVHHVEFSLNGSGLDYEAGDALGVWPQNCPELINELLARLGCDGEEPVSTPAGERPLRTALLQHYDLGKPTAELLHLLDVPTERAPLHVIDALQASTCERPDHRALIGVLRKLQPRLYSISSSHRANPGQVHLTVGAVRYDAHGRLRKGVCSTFLADRATDAGTVGVFIHKNTAFRLPADSDRPVIMIGPGTGIAPFRAFLQERAVTGARGCNWLFFGDQRARSDFLYRDELEAWQADGLLHRLSTAFSRDQAEKVYVQHRMLEEAAELWAWLESGAHVYVCGDAARMARDVDAALHTVIERAGHKSPDEAVAYVQALRSNKRYARDVY